VLKAAHSDFNIPAVNRFLSNPRIVFVGTISYGIYIFHVPIGHFVTNVLVAPWWYPLDFASWGPFAFLGDCMWVLLLPVLSILSVCAAVVSSRYVEQPILKLKDRFFG
ncbi:MAG: hypothetical protein AAB214_02305, partial [Fibrobacterota bacterium]